jgi:hypothetical protein
LIFLNELIEKSPAHRRGMVGERENLSGTGNKGRRKALRGVPEGGYTNKDLLLPRTGCCSMGLPRKYGKPQ